MLIISCCFCTFISIRVSFCSISSQRCTQSSIWPCNHIAPLHQAPSEFSFSLGMILAEGSINSSVRAPITPSAFGRDLSLASGTLTHKHSLLSILRSIQWRESLSAGVSSSLRAAFFSPVLENTVTCVFPGSVSSSQGTHQYLPMFHLLVPTKPDNSLTGATVGFTNLFLCQILETTALHYPSLLS